MEDELVLRSIIVIKYTKKEVKIIVALCKNNFDFFFCLNKNTSLFFYGGCRSPPNPINFEHFKLIGGNIMKDNSKCFIKTEKEVFEEITYKELEERRRMFEEYKNKKFIYIHGMLLEVSKEEYKDYYTEIERNRYCKKVLQKLQVVSIEELNFDEDMKHKEVITDTSKDIEFEIERKIEIEQLRNALLKLDKEEYKLIRELFFNEKTMTEYAKNIGCGVSTIFDKKVKILKKLKKFLKM